MVDGELVDEIYIYEGVLRVKSEDDLHKLCWIVPLCPIGEDEVCNVVRVCPSDFYPNGCPCNLPARCYGSWAYLEEVDCAPCPTPSTTHKLISFQFSAEVPFSVDICPSYNVLIESTTGSSKNLISTPIGNHIFEESELLIDDLGYLDIICITITIESGNHECTPVACSFTECFNISEYECGEGDERSEAIQFSSHSNPKVEAAVNVFPNPFDETLVLDFSIDPLTPIHYQIHDINGRQVMNGVLNAESSRSQISSGQLTTGIYWLKLLSPNGLLRHQQKLVKI